MSGFKKAVLDVVGTKMTAPGRIDQVRVVAEHFRMIDVVSEGFVGAVWEPTAKIKVDAGHWDLRTYTPIEIDPASGRARLLFYLHGEGPASRWAQAAEPGVETRTGGPKASLALTALPGAVVFFGDETSLAAAVTLQRFRGASAATACVFEVGDPAQAATVAADLGLERVSLVARGKDADHIGPVISLIRDQLDAVGAGDLVLTGNGRSIQSVRAALKTEGAGVRQHVKAYWAPGKIGLD